MYKNALYKNPTRNRVGNVYDILPHNFLKNFEYSEIILERERRITYYKCIYSVYTYVFWS